MITVEAKKVGTRMIATVKVGIGTGRFTYTVQFADQGSEAANEAEGSVNCVRLLKKFSRLLVHRERSDTPSSCHFPKPKSLAETASRNKGARQRPDGTLCIK